MSIMRLQGKAFHDSKEQLIPVSYSVSDKGRIRVEYRHRANTRLRFCHWLNPEELAVFDKTTLPQTVWKKKKEQKMQSLDINKVSHEVKLLILHEVLKRMNNDEKLFKDTYGTTYENINSDTYLLDCFIYDLEKCCLYARTLHDMIDDYNRNTEGYIDIPSISNLRGMDLYNAVKECWITDEVIIVITVNDVDWCISFID
jgi:hypothetical protein